MNRMLNDAPTVDAEPVRHGHWIFYRKDLNCKCSKCRYTLKMSDEYRIAYVVMDERYCYHCGARMDEALEVIDDDDKRTP